MPNATITTTLNGWPQLDEDNYLDILPVYTQQLAAKLDTADADVVAAVNAATAAQVAVAAAQAALASIPYVRTVTTLTTGVILVRWGLMRELVVSRAGTFPVGVTMVVDNIVPVADRPPAGLGHARGVANTSGDELGQFIVSMDGAVILVNRTGATRTRVDGRVQWIV